MRAAVPVAASGVRSRASEPLGQQRYKIQFTAGRALHAKLREAQALLRHQIPDGDLAEVFDRALTLLLADAKRKKFAQTARPTMRGRSKTESSVRLGPASRHIPAEIKREVASRDQGRCAFVGRNGQRCESRDFVEFHHIEPWATSKRHSVKGIELRCRAHNHYAAVQDYGVAHMARCRAKGRNDVRSPTRPGAS